MTVLGGRVEVEEEEEVELIIIITLGPMEYIGTFSTFPVLYLCNILFIYLIFIICLAFRTHQLY